MKYSGIIFDLDGTLLDTVYDLHDSLNTILKNHNFNEIALEKTKDFIGNGIFRLIQRSVPEEYKNALDFINQLLAEFKTEYRRRLFNKTRPYPYITELLEYLNSHNIQISVASNKSHDESITLIKTLFPGIKFASVIGHIDGIPHKPDPKIIYEILDDMGLGTDEVLYIGDSITDYQTAENANLDCLMVTYGYEKKDVIDQLINVIKLESSEELKNYLCNL